MDNWKIENVADTLLSHGASEVIFQSAHRTK